MKVVFASNNAHKLTEVRSILVNHEVLSLQDVGFEHEIEETGSTLEANSLIKAKAVSDWFKAQGKTMSVFADDTGLEIAALGGQPGVYTARWAGEPSNPANNRAKALASLQGISQREARFRTVITLIHNGQCAQMEGVVNGQIATHEVGQGGFGYDPIFIPEGYNQTFAQLPPEIKNTISHRARAMQQLKHYMQQHLLLLILSLLFPLSAWGESWKSHYAYNNVSQIAVTQEEAFALSDGSLFSVNRQSEQINTYDAANGLHDTGIACIGYDSVSHQLLIAYTTGNLDILLPNGKVDYVGDYYLKDMFALKTPNNITFNQGNAYMATPWGVLSFNMFNHMFVNCCYIGEQAAEVNVEDIVIQHDSIYAFSNNNLYVAHMNDNLLDYRYWTKTSNNGRVQKDPNKGKKAFDKDGDLWQVGGEKGLLRHTCLGQDYAYLPNGPMNNLAYRMFVYGDRLYMVNGGRWSSQYNRPGCVSILDTKRWHNVSQRQIAAQLDGNPFTDCMNIAQDPNDENHYYISCYGNGLIEMQGDSVVQQFLSHNSTIEAAAPLFPTRYTRCDGATFDSNGNLWLVVAGDYGSLIVYRQPNGEWGEMPVIVQGQQVHMGTPNYFYIDNHNENIKWVVSARNTAGVLMVDDKGTVDDTDDDEAAIRYIWKNQNGETIEPASLCASFQDLEGNLWLGGENTGLFYIPKEVNFLTSDQCVQVLTLDEDSNPLLQTQTINAIAEDGKGNIWVASTAGIYVLSPDGQTILSHYTVSNTILPTNTILSLAYHANEERMYVGTAAGVFSYEDYSTQTQEQSSNSQSSSTTITSSTYDWTAHLSYSNIYKVVDAGDVVYGLSDGALFSVDKKTEEITTHSKITGLNGSYVQHIAYDANTKQLVVIYEDNNIDLIQGNNIYLLSDLYLKTTTSSVTYQVNNIYIRDSKAYLSMTFGVIVLDLKKREVKDTYYIGFNASNVNILSIALAQDTLYAASHDSIYCASVKSNLLDYAQWSRIPMPNARYIDKLMSYQDTLLASQDSIAYIYSNGNWKKMDSSSYRYRWITISNDQLLSATLGQGFYKWNNGKWEQVTPWNTSCDAAYDAHLGGYWYATGYALFRFRGGYQRFNPSGPYSNNAFRLQAIGERIYMAPGGRWSSQYKRPADAIWYDCLNKDWHVVTQATTMKTIQPDAPQDILFYAASASNPEHFYAATYGFGVIEYHGEEAYQQFTFDNSTLRSAVPAADKNVRRYVRTDGVLVDKDSNLWVLNTGDYAKALNVMDKYGNWYGLPLKISGQNLVLETPSYLVQDNTNSQRKWFLEQRNSIGVVLFDDGGSPYYSYGDRTIKRSQFLDQNNKLIAPSALNCLAQDRSGDIWVGYEQGLFIIPASYDMFSTNQCKRVIIPRNDGTGLADYLLGTEPINAIVVDGANRKWIGTATSGVYLVSSDGMEELQHFTYENSPLFSNEVLSIAIQPRTGEVFFSTSKGVISYRGDAAEPSASYDNAYAYPNPVRPDYSGKITITGLMDQSVVNIIDSGGNLVCKTNANGGIAIWDGKDQRGRRAASGVYTALCNTANGDHTTVKILVL